VVNQHTVIRKTPAQIDSPRSGKIVPCKSLPASSELIDFLGRKAGFGTMSKGNVDACALRSEGNSNSSRYS
jgi:hypothetical protein